jgi:hypothetical protein
MILCAVLATGPCVGYGVYLWKQKKYAAMVGGLLPGVLAVAAAVLVAVLVRV